MDNGAHFFKCDFQVHTPRDLNWQGAGAVTDDDRRDYSRELVAACRVKGIHAVAITDHHDVAFFKHIREAAAGETDDLGKPLPVAERLVVFPGLELTLGIPCQALLLFDADLASEFLPLSLTALGITPADAAEEKHAPIQKLDIMSFVDLYAALDKLDPLRGRYIVFPHTSDGGHKTLLRQGFEKHYISMPCVGGYVDGALPQPPKAAGMRTITNGEDKNWGNKPLGLFQTSDCRSRDLGTLGAHATWVKWARPTAEALRQACLARRSRISHSEPRLPPIRITRIEVSNSKFLGPVVLDFNPQYNALIGGRGTGKSTILEYVRWALCDQPPGSAGEEDELADFQKRRKALIEGTLLPLDAVIDVEFLLNGVAHTVRRKASGDITLKIGEAPFQPCTEHNVREILPIRAYSQKQLSAVGARLDELRRFVDAPIQVDLDALEERTASLSADVRGAFDRVIRCRALQAEIAAHDIETRSLTEQIEKLRGSLKGLSPGDRATITREAAYEAEQRVVHAFERDANAAKSALTAAATQLKRLPTPAERHNMPENADLLAQAHAALAGWIAEAQQVIARLEAAFGDPIAETPLGAHFGRIAEWSARREGHRKEYEAATARAASHEETLRQIRLLEGRLGEINETADTKLQQLASLGDAAAEFDSLRGEWKAIHRRRADLLDAQCKALTDIAKTKLRATLRRAADIEPLGERLRQLLKGTKARTERADKLVEQVSAAADPPATWDAILDELLALAWLTVEDDSVTPLPPVTRLDMAGFTRKEKLALARQLVPAQWLDLLLFDLKDLPVFEYQVRADDFLPFENASPGQQATALLSVLLLQDGPPLVIDQPEDDLNMKIINEIVETLWRTHSP